MKNLLVLLFVLYFTSPIFSEIILNSPKNGFTTDSVQKISGTVTNYNDNKITMIFNGIPQTILLENNQFNVNTVVAPGNNLIELKAGNFNEKISFFAKVPNRDIKVVLSWDTPTDLDLWVVDPKGNKCYYANRSIPTGGNLDVDVTSGYGPETFTMAKALPGTYAVQVQYYSSNAAPITRVKIFVVLYEGTSREKVIPYNFVMNKEYQVYHLTNFSIENE